MKPYYSHNGIVIYHGDAREIAPALGRFDLLLTDPPYGLGIAANPVRQAHEVSDWDNAPVDADLLSALVLQADKSIVWGGNYFGLPPAQCFLVWDKVQPQDFSTGMCEQAWSNLKMPAKLFKKRVLSYAKQHPTQKPAALMEWCIGFCPEVQTILDPFAGSGTTGQAAKNLGKRAVLIELAEHYCEVAAQRLSQEVLDFGDVA